MDWTSFTECFLDSCRARGRALLTVATYRADLNAFGAWYEESTGAAPDPIAITSLDVAEYRSWLHRRWKPATTNRRLAVVKAAFTWAAGEGLVTASPAAQVRPVAAERPGPRSVDGRTLSALLREAQRAGSARDVALITLLVKPGCASPRPWRCAGPISPSGSGAASWSCERERVHGIGRCPCRSPPVGRWRPGARRVGQTRHPHRTPPCSQAARVRTH